MEQCILIELHNPREANLHLLLLSKHYSLRYTLYIHSQNPRSFLFGKCPLAEKNNCQEALQGMDNRNKYLQIL